MRWDSYSPISFVGLRNFQLMLKDSSFKIAFWNTLYFTGLTVPLTIVAALALALVLNKGLRSVKIFRSIHFFPHVASTIAVAVVWQFLYHPDMGPINHFLRAGIGDPPRWTASVTWYATVIDDECGSAGYYMGDVSRRLQVFPAPLRGGH